MKRRLNLLLLALVMLLALLPVNVMAAESPEPVKIPFQVNPLYQDVYTPEDLPTEAGPEPDAEFSEEPEVLWAGSYVSVNDAAVQLRKAMTQRKASCDLYILYETSSYEDCINETLMKAMEHTGNPKEGDYLLWQLAGYGGEVYEEMQNDMYAFHFVLDLQYYTTAAQETEMDTAVKNLLSQLGVSGKSDYQKVKAVYDYIINNVTYDEAHLNDETYTLKFTAYAALKNKTAVCQGYANLLYRLLLEMGIDCRVITGETDGGAHAWNIAKLGNVYYNLDSTWDAGYDDYAYFLRNSEGFADHYRYLEYATTQFHTDYPMSATDYVDGVEGEPEHIYVYGTCGNDAYWSIDRDKVLTIFGTGATMDFDQSKDTENSPPWYHWMDGFHTVVIDEGITSIGDFAFMEMDNIQNVHFPDTLTEFGMYVFRDCSGLKSVVIPDSITAIETGVFYLCDGLEAVTLSKNLKEIASYAFESCTSLKSIAFPEGLLRIRSAAFDHCNALTEVTIPASVTMLEGFQGCKNLTTVYLNNTTVGHYAFNACEKLHNIVFNGAVADIGMCAFQKCTGLTEIVIPTSVTTLNTSAFEDCTGLKRVVLNNSGVVDRYAFSGCTNLKEVVIGDGITGLYDEAFNRCQALEEITIPGSVTELGYLSLGECYLLKKITFEGDVPIIDGSAFLDVTATAYYPGENPTWTADKLQNYGGTLTWVSTHTHDFTGVEPEFDPAAKTHTWDCLTCDSGVTEACTFEMAVTRAATLDTHGIREYTCTVCDGSYEEEFVYRIYGKNRYQTAFSAADALKEQLGVETFDNIIVASGLQFADALAGSYLATVKNAPILLVNSGTVGEVAEYVEENLSEDGTVYLLGGTAAVPAEMETALDGLNVKRLSGKNRLGTNLAILEEAGIGDEEILVCTGWGFADSLSASAVGKPILLVGSELNQEQKDFLETASGEFVIIGGTGAVKASVQEELMNYGSVSRLSGKTRYETSVLVAERFFDDPDTVLLAYGQNFPDGLCGGPLAYELGAPLILCANNSRDAADAYVQENAIAKGAVLGGASLISDATAIAVFAVTAE